MFAYQLIIKTPMRKISFLSPNIDGNTDKYHSIW